MTLLVGMCMLIVYVLVYSRDCIFYIDRVHGGQKQHVFILPGSARESGQIWDVIQVCQPHHKTKN